MSNGSEYDPLNYGIRDAFQSRNVQDFQLKMLKNVVEYVEKHLPDGEWLVREDYDVFFCRHQVLIENPTTNFHVRMDIDNADWNKMYAIDLVNEVLRQMIANSPQKIQPIEPAEPKIMKCKVCGGPMEAPYILCKFCGQTYRIGGKL